MARQPVCCTCAYWEFLYKNRMDSDYALGECRRHAPAPMQHVMKEIARSVGLTAFAVETMAEFTENEHYEGHDYLAEMSEKYRVYEWPRTDAADWCGEYSMISRVVVPLLANRRARRRQAEEWERSVGLDKDPEPQSSAPVLQEEGVE